MYSYTVMEYDESIPFHYILVYILNGICSIPGAFILLPIGLAYIQNYNK